MERTEVKKLYRNAWYKWGQELQLGMLMEECAELIQATNKVLRTNGQNNNAWRQMASEIADVEIMIDQIKTLVTWQDLRVLVSTEKHDKLLRLKNVLDKD